MTTRLVVLLLLPLGAMVLMGCSSNKAKANCWAAAMPSVPPTPVVVDGFIDDWKSHAAAHVKDELDDATGPTDVVGLTARRNGDAVYLKLDLATAANLQKPAEGGGLRIHLTYEVAGTDATDGTNQTTLTLDTAERLIERDGTPIPFAAVDYVALPTYAATAFEIRLRLPDGGEASSPRGMGPLRVTIDGSDTLSQPLVLDGRETWKAPEAIDVARGDVPLRVVSWNVLQGGPFADSEREADGKKVIAALDPDVLLLQEVWRIENLAERVRAVCGADWTVIETRGVAVASRLPMTALDLASLSEDAVEAALAADGGDAYARVGDSWAVRRNLFAGIDTPAGPMVFVSSHWKCCGYVGSSEDLQRMDDALHALKAISRLREGGVAGEWDPVTETTPIIKPVPERFITAPIMIAGDYNLVGSRTPLDMLLTTGLVELVPMQSDEPIAATWRSLWDERATMSADGRAEWRPGGFPEGRLDIAVVSPELNVIRSFVADLGAPTMLSDHLPVVVDVAE